VHVLVTGEGAELLDPGLHVVQRHPFACRDRLQVNLVDHSFVVGDHPVGHVDAELRLRPEHGEPQLPLQDHLVLGRPQLGQLDRGVATGENVRDARLGRHV
jgi:hypothetical protein